MAKVSRGEALVLPKRRFCFALDNVLVSAPLKPGDFATVQPPNPNPNPNPYPNPNPNPSPNPDPNPNPNQVRGRLHRQPRAPALVAHPRAARHP